MAFRRRLGNLAQTLLMQHLERQNAEHQSNLVKERQSELASQRAGESILSRLGQDPNLARRHQQMYPDKEIAGINTRVFVPTPEQDLSEASEGIDKIPDLAGLPTQEGLSGRFGDRVPIATLMAQVEARRNQILGAEKPELKETVNPDGSKALIAVNPRDVKEQIPTEIGPVAAGELKGQAENAETRIAGPTRAAQAGRVAGAEAMARHQAEGRYLSSAEGQAMMRSKAQAALNQSVSQAQGAAVVKATETSAKFLPNVLELEKKWKQAQPEIARLVEGGLLGDENMAIIQTRGIQGLPQTIQEMMSPPVRQYFEMRQTYMPIFARVLSEVGNLNEQEQQRAVGLAPSGIDARNGGASGTEKMERMKMLLVNMPEITQAMFAAQGAGPEERLRIIEQYLPQEPTQPQMEGPVNPALQAAREKLNRTRGLP